ncbi:hypothetical protein [Christiangramia echinicola]|uniref:Uncharacterized protein n=1 Tax=Christiangramia echinicola TaxID=279359 RepID=A0A1H1NLC6_9FLAO|nr:hypothetical protein [Christiangramia echinicola]SDR99515.1 hypothetical protein SAMN04488552_1764 [Christiangramia echinicola]
MENLVSTDPEFQKIYASMEKKVSVIRRVIIGVGLILMALVAVFQ